MCGETRRAVKMFETALAHNPTSQSLQRDLFFCHVLQGDYKQQQLVIYCIFITILAPISARNSGTRR
jgi:hypothetical protein